MLATVVTLGGRAFAEADSALFAAAASGSAEEVRWALRRGANPNARSSEHGIVAWTPLMLAVSRGAGADVVLVLLHAGTSVNARSEHGGRTALSIEISRHARLDIVQRLIDAGANVSIQALAGAVRSDTSDDERPDVVQLLLEILDADPDVDVSAAASEALMRALAGPTRSEIVRLLLAAGADVNVEGSDQPLHLAVRNSQSADVVQLLIDAGADVNAFDHIQNTPLLMASEGNDAAVVRALIDAGADVNFQNRRGHALTNAAESSTNPAVVRALIDAGADVNAFDYTPLMIAAKHNSNPEVVQVLLDAGADVNARWGGSTALGYARRNTHLQGTDVYYQILDASHD